MVTVLLVVLAFLVGWWFGWLDHHRRVSDAEWVRSWELRRGRIGADR